jgi:hypothetical protein
VWSPVQAQQLSIQEHRGSTLRVQLAGRHGSYGLHTQHEQASDHERLLLICEAIRCVCVCVCVRVCAYCEWLSVSSLALWDEGVYACVCVHASGKLNVLCFHIIVRKRGG